MGTTSIQKEYKELKTAARKPQSPGALKFQRFLHNRTAIISAAIILAFVFMAVFAPHLAPHDPNRGDVSRRLETPSREFPLGTDQQGRDQLTRVIYGSRVALTVGALTILIGLGFGSILGLTAGWFYGKFIDTIIMRIMDIFLAFPYILLIVAVVSMLGPSMRNAIIAIGITIVPHFARIFRSVVIGIREREYVVAGEALGASRTRIILRHVIPNSLAPMIVTTTMYFGRNVLAEATLSFLGLGIQPPTAAWGTMVAVGREYLRTDPHLGLLPGAVLLLLVYALNTFGDGLRDILDPKIQ